MQDIKSNLTTIHARIEKACRKAGRKKEEVKLLLATKTVPAERILIAGECGENLIGENRVQEAVEKLEAIEHFPFERHFIGHLQSNKVKDILKYAHTIQSIDRLSIAEKLENHLQKEGRSINVLIQVNSSYEESKFGMEPEKAIELLRSVSKLSCLRIKGLMTIGANTEEETLIRKSFQIIKNLQKQIIKEGIEGVSMDILSMGMSSDLELAIEEGSSLIRVGSAVFGNRG